MKIELMRLEISHFMGIISWSHQFDGRNWTIEAENGVGKTAIDHAVSWCFFGISCKGETKFGVRPVDSKRNPITGLTVSVKATIKADGREIVLLRQQVESIIKGQVDGFDTVCHIDGVPKKVGEYNDYISDLIDKEQFKTVTILEYFNQKLKGPARRKILLDIAGNIKRVTGFDDFLDVLAVGNLTIEDLKAKLKFQLYGTGKNDSIGYIGERKKIPIQIEELTLSMGQYASTDPSQADKQRIVIDAEIRTLKQKENSLLGSSTERQRSLDLIEALKQKMMQRCNELNAGRTDLVRLSDEKYQLRSKTTGLRNKVDEEAHKLKNTKIALNIHLRELGRVRDDYDALVLTTSDEICFNCNQTYPADKLEEFGKAKAQKYVDLEKSGNEAQREIKAAKVEIEAIENCTATYQTELAEAESHLTVRGAEIDGLLVDVKPIDPAGDKTWEIFDTKVIESELSDSVVDVLQELRGKIETKQTASKALTTILATSDRHAKDSDRIQVLKGKEIELSQMILDIESQLDEIANYIKAENELIAKSVNAKFKHVEFQLFKTLINGSIEEVCEATYDGVTYSGLSTGEKIFVNIDVVNVLSEHYGISVVLFLDNSESFNMEMEAKSQVIKLKAVKGVSQLVVK